MTTATAAADTAAMRAAIAAAEAFLGATAPNPPVGCAALDRHGAILACAAHRRAGSAHAEVEAMALAQAGGRLSDVHTLVVTLEPCNHQGRTPPCTEAILRHGHIRRVVIGADDPNPGVAGGGTQRLRAAGLEVVTGVLGPDCRHLVRAFAKSVRQRRPYVTLKAAFTSGGSMVPPAGRKTFTSAESLRWAHALRRRADALWTGSGTVLADDPLFTVREVPDHPGKRRVLVLSDRRRRIPPSWIARAESNGFEVCHAATFAHGLDLLGQRGVLEVLVEAGPTLHAAWMASGLWDESVIIRQGASPADADTIQVHRRDAIEGS